MEIFLRIFRIDAALDGVRSRSRILNVRRELFPGRDANLFLDQVATVNFLRDRVLDLDSRVHLDEVIMALVIDQEFHRAGVLITHRLRQLDGRVPHFLAQGRRS